MIHVGIVSEFFDPEGGSAVVPGFIARTLAKRGMAVDVLTAFPNYPQGRIYLNHRQAPHVVEKHGNVQVHRVPLYPSHSDRPLSRIATYCSFAFSSSLAMGCLRKCDVVLVYSTPVSVGLGPALRTLAQRRPVVTLIQDLWPDTLIHSGMVRDGLFWRLVTKAAEAFSDWVYRRSDAVAVIAPSMVDALIARGVPESKLHVLYNWLPDELLPDSQESAGGRSGPRAGTHFIYAGNMGEPQGVDTIVQAAILLRGRSDITFTLVGSGVLAPRLQDCISKERLNNVEFIDQRPLEEVRNLVANADAQIVTLAPRRLFEMTIPSKIQFSLAFGKPFVAAVAGDAARVASDSGAAVVCEPGDPHGLAAAVLSLASLSDEVLEGMGRRGEEYFQRHFSEAVAGAALVTLLEEVVFAARESG